MRAARIENGVVVDVIVIGDESGLAWAETNLGGNWVVGTGGDIGDLYVNGAFVSPSQIQDEQ